MISIELGREQQSRLDELARAEGEDSAALARRIVLDYLEFHALPRDSDQAWAEASVALTPEIIAHEDWQPGVHES